MPGLCHEFFRSGGVSYRVMMKRRSFARPLRTSVHMMRPKNSCREKKRNISKFVETSDDKTNSFDNIIRAEATRYHRTCTRSATWGDAQATRAEHRDTCTNCYRHFSLVLRALLAFTDMLPCVQQDLPETIDPCQSGILRGSSHELCVGQRSSAGGIFAGVQSVASKQQGVAAHKAMRSVLQGQAPWGMYAAILPRAG